MSFSSEVKEEITKHIGNSNHCKIAELSAIISLCGSVIIDEQNNYKIRIHTETKAVAETIKVLMWKTFHINTEITEKNNAYSKNLKTYTIIVKNSEEALKILESTKLIGTDGNIEENLSVKNNVIIMKDCCKRAFIKGSFLAAGSINDPNKSYHMEINCGGEKKAEQITNLLKKFDIKGKMVARKGNYVVYIKEGESIINVLNVMEAHIALMKMENIRILKGMSNYYNRQVNCETANIKKTVTTACRQIDDINFIVEEYGLDFLPKKLQEIAILRIENPDSSLQELGQMIEPQISKSGVNHRLRKICQMADDLRG